MRPSELGSASCWLIRKPADSDSVVCWVIVLTTSVAFSVRVSIELSQCRRAYRTPPPWRTPTAYSTPALVSVTTLTHLSGLGSDVTCATARIPQKRTGCSCDSQKPCSDRGSSSGSLLCRLVQPKSPTAVEDAVREHRRTALMTVSVTQTNAAMPVVVDRDALAVVAVTVRGLRGVAGTCARRCRSAPGRRAIAQPMLCDGVRKLGTRPPTFGSPSACPGSAVTSTVTAGRARARRRRRRGRRCRRLGRRVGRVRRRRGLLGLVAGGPTFFGVLVATSVRRRTSGHEQRGQDSRHEWRCAHGDLLV